MSYEFRIGWRYLYRGVGSRRLAIGLVVSALVGLVGGALFFASDGSSIVFGSLKIGIADSAKNR